MYPQYGFARLQSVGAPWRAFGNFWNRQGTSKTFEALRGPSGTLEEHSWTLGDLYGSCLDIGGPSENFGDLGDLRGTFGDVRAPLGNLRRLSGIFGEPSGNLQGTFGDLRGPSGNLWGRFETLEEPAESQRRTLDS